MLLQLPWEPWESHTSLTFCVQRDVARRRREEEAQTERKNPIQQYIDLLQSQDEAAWKDTLIGMGQGPEIPKLFRLSGKVSRRPVTAAAQHLCRGQPLAALQGSPGWLAG